MSHSEIKHIVGAIKGSLTHQEHLSLFKNIYTSQKALVDAVTKTQGVFADSQINLRGFSISQNLLSALAQFGVGLLNLTKRIVLGLNKLEDINFSILLELIREST